jgi:hypothetical protein
VKSSNAPHSCCHPHLSPCPPSNGEAREETCQEHVSDQSRIAPPPHVAWGGADSGCRHAWGGADSGCRYAWGGADSGCRHAAGGRTPGGPFRIEDHPLRALTPSSAVHPVLPTQPSPRRAIVACQPIPSILPIVTVVRSPPPCEHVHPPSDTLQRAHPLPLTLISSSMSSPVRSCPPACSVSPSASPSPSSMSRNTRHDLVRCEAAGPPCRSRCEAAH